MKAACQVASGETGLASDRADAFSFVPFSIPSFVRRLRLTKPPKSQDDRTELPHRKNQDKQRRCRWRKRQASLAYSRIKRSRSESKCKVAGPAEALNRSCRYERRLSTGECTALAKRERRARSKSRKDWAGLGRGPAYIKGQRLRGWWRVRSRGARDEQGGDMGRSWLEAEVLVGDPGSGNLIYDDGRHPSGILCFRDVSS